VAPAPLLASVSPMRFLAFLLCHGFLLLVASEVAGGDA
jgi:hypothetical protein